MSDGVPPQAHRCRAFGLMDSLILVAAIGAALAIARYPLDALGRGLGSIRFEDLLVWTFASWSPFLLCGSLAFAIIRFRRPRPPLREVVRQPGMLAHLVLTLMIVSLIGFNLWLAGFNAAHGLDLQVPRALGHIANLALASAVPVTWSVQKGRELWRPEPGWIDRLGQVLGVCWSVDFLLLLAAFLLMDWSF
jgi:hypothetical protein